MRRTKIIATIGPASDRDEVLDQLIGAGMDIARLNFSHGTHDTHAATVRRLRAAARRAGREVAVLADLGGPKIRTGALEGGKALHLHPGDGLRIVTGEGTGGPGVVFTNFGGLAKGVAGGDRLLLADGAIELRVERSDGRSIETTVVEGGTLGEHKGINAPGVRLAASAVTARDGEDLRFGVSIGVDFIGVSFVREAADLRAARNLLAAAGREDVPIVAKIERPEALDGLDGILDACESVMVARGDLGLEMPLERVPTAQKRITIDARRHGTPVIVATQVLDSMTRGARPTRAEVSDAANAVADGVDAIMLAGETAIGLFPVQAVRMLDAIIREAESGPEVAPLPTSDPERFGHLHAICEAAVTLAERGGADAIVAVTRGGSTARRLSSLRPRVPVLAATDREETARRLTICWGVVPVCVELGEHVDPAGVAIARQLQARGAARPGSALVFVNVHDDLSRPDANYLTIQRV